MYKTLDTLPIVVYFKICKTGDIGLLNPKKEKISQEDLLELWDELSDEYQNIDDNYLNNKILSLSKNYHYYVLMYDIIGRAVESLKFDYNEYLVNLLKKNGFKVSKESYLEDLETVKKNSEGLLIKAKHFKSQLLKPDKTEDKDNASIEDVLASFSNVLGFHIGAYRKITCMEYFGIKKQVTLKIKQQEAQLRELKKHKK